MEMAAFQFCNLLLSFNFKSFSSYFIMMILEVTYYSALCIYCNSLTTPFLWKKCHRRNGWRNLEIFVVRAKISKNRQSKSWGANMFPMVPAGNTMTSEWKLPLDKWWYSKLHLAQTWSRCFKQGVRYLRLFLFISDSSKVFPAPICPGINDFFSSPYLPRIHCYSPWARLFARLIQSKFYSTDCGLFQTVLNSKQQLIPSWVGPYCSWVKIKKERNKPNIWKSKHKQIN